MPSNEYHQRDNEADEIMEEQKEGLLGDGKIWPPLKSPRWHWIPVALLALSSCLNLFLVFRLRQETQAGPQSSYESGFSSDLSLAKPEISLVRKPFSGGVELDQHGGFTTGEDGHIYVGKPSKELDEAWEELLSGLNIEIAHEELDLSGSTFRWPENGLYFSGLEVYHALHCLNRLRQALYIEDYGYIFDRPGDPPLQHHVDHCINHIRQALQCQADLTPMEWKLEGSKIILKTDTLHTCRDWDKIHAWASSRRTKFEELESWRNGSLIVPPEQSIEPWFYEQHLKSLKS